MPGAVDRGHGGALGQVPLDLLLQPELSQPDITRIKAVQVHPQLIEQHISNVAVQVTAPVTSDVGQLAEVGVTGKCTDDSHPAAGLVVADWGAKRNAGIIQVVTDPLGSLQELPGVSSTLPGIS